MYQTEIPGNLPKGEKPQEFRIPERGHHCGSWVVTRKVTGEVIGEFFDRRSVERFNPEKVTVQNTAQYLAALNRRPHP